MKNFTKREKRIIAAVYHDCERIALERSWEQVHHEPAITGKVMADHLAELFIGRRDHIVKYGVDLPSKRYRYHP